jgi:hypothetical protein
VAGTLALARTPGKPEAWAHATAIVLRDAGLLVKASGIHLPQQPLRLRFESADATGDVEVGGSRGQLLFGHLTPPNPQNARTSLSIAEGAVRIRCRDHRAEAGKMRLWGEDAGLPNLEVAVYECETGAVSLLGAP